MIKIGQTRVAGCCVLLALLSGELAAQGHTPTIHGDVTVRYDDNVTRAQYERDKEEDSTISALAQIDYLEQLNETSGLIFSASVEGEKFTDFDELDNVNLKLAANYKWHLGYGFYSPRLAFNATYNNRSFVNEQRTGDGFSFGADFTRRFTETLLITVGARIRSYDADSDVFSVDDTSVFVNTDWQLSPRWAAYGTLRLLTGDVVSTAEPTLDIINASDEIEPDRLRGIIAKLVEANRAAGD